MKCSFLYLISACPSGHYTFIIIITTQSCPVGRWLYFMCDTYFEIFIFLIVIEYVYLM